MPPPVVGLVRPAASPTDIALWLYVGVYGLTGIPHLRSGLSISL